jgi:hypothetical protein
MALQQTSAILRENLPLAKEGMFGGSQLFAVVVAGKEVTVDI